LKCRVGTDEDRKDRVREAAVEWGVAARAERGKKADPKGKGSAEALVVAAGLVAAAAVAWDVARGAAVSRRKCRVLSSLNSNQARLPACKQAGP